MADATSSKQSGQQLQLPQTMVAGSTIEETANRTTQEKHKSMIHRFPSDLARIGRERDYIAPKTVAIGPYYHGTSELRAMEEVKLTAVHYFFQGLAESKEAAYERIKPIARRARICYADADALKGTTDDKFAAMMFVDGCFLVQFFDTMLGRKGPGTSLRSTFQPRFLGILRDMMLLENQIPWPVMEFFMALKSLTMEDMVRNLLVPYLHGTLASDPLAVEINEDYKPSHLLCLIQFYEACGKHVKQGGHVPVKRKQRSQSRYTSARELAAIGIKLKASKTKQFSDMNIVEGTAFAKLSLAPLNMGTTIACWLINMAAFEMCTESIWTDSCPVSSYICFMSGLMNKEEDVRELHVKSIVRGWSDKEVLEFFKDLAQNLSVGRAHFQINTGLEAYKCKRRVWIAVYKFVYNNSKAILALLSVIGVLVGIFKALLSLKQH